MPAHLITMLKTRRSPMLIAVVATGLVLLAGAAVGQSGPPPKQDADRRDPPAAQKAPEPGKPAVQDAAGQGQAAPKAEAPKARRGGKDPVREPEEEDDL